MKNNFSIKTKYISENLGEVIIIYYFFKRNQKNIFSVRRSQGKYISYQNIDFYTNANINFLSFISLKTSL